MTEAFCQKGKKDKHIICQLFRVLTTYIKPTKMCLLLMMTFMSVCVKKAKQGSCVREICLLTCIAIIPLLSFMGGIYFLTSYMLPDKMEQLSTKCEKSRVLGIVEKVYPDSEQLRFLCTGLNFGDNLAITLTECFNQGEPISHKHFLTSHSEYWSKDQTLHLIRSFRNVEEKGQSVTVIEVEPHLPEPCPPEESSLDGDDDNFFYVEEEYQPESYHIMMGWQYKSRQANQPFSRLTVINYCAPSFPSAVVFTKNGYFTGFQSGRCTDTDEFEQALVPYSMFLKKIHQLYPNVEYKNPERGSQASEGRRFLGRGRRKMLRHKARILKSDTRIFKKQVLTDVPPIEGIETTKSKVVKSFKIMENLMGNNTNNFLILSRKRDTSRILSNVSIGNNSGIQKKENALQVNKNQQYISFDS